MVGIREKKRKKKERKEKKAREQMEETRASVASFPAPGDANGLFYYVSGVGIELVLDYYDAFDSLAGHFVWHWSESGVCADDSVHG